MDWINAGFVITDQALSLFSSTCNFKVKVLHVNMKLPTWILVFLWIAPSLFTGVFQKQVIQQLSNPLILTMAGMIIGVFLDYVILCALLWNNSDKTIRKTNFYIFNIAKFKSCMMSGICFAGGQALTLTSFQYIPVSFSFTIKTTSPIFTLILSLLTNTKSNNSDWKTVNGSSTIDSKQIAALCVFVTGVCISSVSEIDFNMIGFSLSVGATLCSSLYGISSKTALNSTYSSDGMNTKNEQETNKLSPTELHMYNNLCAFLLIGCFYIVTETMKRGLVDNDSLFAIGLDDLSSLSHLSYVVMLQGFTACVLLTMEFNFSLLVLDRINNILHQIFCTLQRLIGIIVSIVYFDRKVTILNYIGIGLAFTGFAMYQKLQKVQHPKSKKL